MALPTPRRPRDLTQIPGITRRPDGRYRIRRMIRGIPVEEVTWEEDEVWAIYQRLFRPDARPVALARGTTVLRYVEDYLELRMDLSASSRRTYDSLVNAYLRPNRHFANLRIAELTPEDVNAFLRRLSSSIGARTGQPLTPQTVAQVRKLLSGAMSHAERAGRISRNPVRLAKGPRVERASISPLTHDEVDHLLHQVRGDRLEALYAMSLASGMRQGELLALRWSELDLDPDRPTARINATMYRGDRIERPKTERSRRTIRLPRALVPVLLRHGERQAAERRAAKVWHNREQLVFATRSGLPINPRNLLRHLERMAAESGVTLSRAERGVLERLRWHDFRHTFATEQLSAEGDSIELSRHLGHSSTRQTDQYVHVTDRMRDRVAERAETMLRSLGS